MHAIHFALTLDQEITIDEVRERLAANKRVAITYRKSANSVFSFGRDHGYFGRILSQTVVAIETLAVRNGNTLIGFCFTPQDGNPLLSSLAATLWYLNPAEVDQRLDIMRPYLFHEV
jgi:glyceraldehyde-3-phosphate dehydrogenase (NAD(P))